MIELQKKFRQQILQITAGEFSLSLQDIVFSIPPERKFGDLSLTLPFVLAKKAKKPPVWVGNRLKELLNDRLEEVEKIELAGGGFLNFYLRRDRFYQYVKQTLNRPSEKKNQKVVVEHTSINPNKSAHIGHLRNSCLGDTLVKGYAFLGYNVEVQNYIDDTGIQMADVVWGLLYREKKSCEEIGAIPDLARYLWRLYPEVSREFEANPALDAQRKEVHRRIEAKVNPEYEACRIIAGRVLHDHIRVNESVGIRYDLLVHESDIISRGLFSETERLLKEKKVLYLSQDREKEGCWVIFYEKDQLEKVVIRSNGTITYIGKDIANTLWKFGLLQNNFLYKPFYTYPDRRFLWSTAEGEEESSAPPFAGADRAVNVIDVRQSYLQSIIQQVLIQLGYPEAAERFLHYAYEMVALTPACVKELGLELDPDEEKKAYVEVSGRKGRAVRAEDLLETMIRKSHQEVRRRNPSLPDEEVESIARGIAVGALRYFLIKFHLNTVIAFDFQEALNFEGDTGPYLQYTLVRLNSIMNKLSAADIQDAVQTASFSRLDEQEASIGWEMILNLSLLETQVDYALERLDLSSLASFANSLCQKFNRYYHLYPVLSETEREKQNLRISLLWIFRKKIEQLLDIMGIPIPKKM